MTQFEYRVIQRTNPAVVNIQAELDEFGIEGYELVAVDADFYYFKRQK